MAISKAHFLFISLLVGGGKESLKLKIHPVVWGMLLVAQLVETLRYKL